MKLKTIKIGNMCCGRCITAVAQIFNQLEIKYEKIDLGYAIIESRKDIQGTALESSFKKSGFKILKSREEEISEKIKLAVHKLFAEN